MSQPIQPLEVDPHGCLRFKENKIVRYLLDNGGIDLNQLACIDFPNEDREQFSQLIGYSLSGFGELSHVTDETYDAAKMMHDNGCDEKDARIAYLQETLDNVRAGLKIIVPEVFRIHPDDLNGN